MTVRAALEKNRFALLCIELADRNELLGWNRILSTPRGVLTNRRAAREPRDVRSDREHFFRRRRRQHLRHGFL